MHRRGFLLLPGIDAARWTQLSPYLDEARLLDVSERAARLRELARREPDVATELWTGP